MEYEAKLTDIIASLPEVAGGFLYAPDRGIYSNQTNGIAADESLQKVGQKLTKIVSMLAVHFHDTGAIRVNFRDLVLFGTAVNDGHWLFLLHQPALSPGMLKMTVQMALNIEPVVTPQEQIQEVAHNTTNAVSAPKDNIMEILLAEESELKDPLSKVQEQLAHYIGPVAELVFEDSVEIWAANATPSLENLPQLLSMLAEEIDDDGDRDKFNNCLQSKEEE